MSDENLLNGGGMQAGDGASTPSVPDGVTIGKLEKRIANLEKLLRPDMTPEQVAGIVSAHASGVFPWEDVTLPSLGLYYGWGEGTMQVRPFSGTIERHLANQRLALTGKTLDLIFSTCCKFPDGFDASDLISGDYIFLLYYLRGITHGPLYEFVATCPYCKGTFTSAFNLQELMDTVTWGNPALGPEPFKITLPVLSQSFGQPIWVEIRHLRSKDASNILRLQRAKNTAIGGRAHVQRRGGGPPLPQTQTIDSDDVLENNLESLVVTFMGDPDRGKITNVIGQAHLADRNAIRDWLDNNMPGISTVVSVACTKCDKDFLIPLPITPSFFRPEAASGIREGVSPAP